ncbi:MAG: restriction endonuclease subunit S [Cellvibrionaceae bacterium]
MRGSTLPQGWIEAPLSEYVMNRDGARVPISSKERAKRQGGYPYYGATGKIDSLDSYTHEGVNILIGEDGANLLSRSKPTAFIAEGKYWVNNHAHVVGCFGGCSASYFNYYFNSLDLSAWVSGSAQPKLNQKNLGTIPVKVPPLNEQTRIANKLDELLAQVDTIKARVDAIPAILKRFRQSVLAAAVSGKLTEGGAVSWPIKPVSELVKVLNGKAFPSKDYQDSGARLLRPGNLHVSGAVVWTEKNTTYIPESWLEKRPELILSEGSLLMNLTAQSLKDEFLGRVCVLGTEEDVLLNQRICSFQSELDYDVKPFLYIYFKSPQFRSFVATLDSGSLIKHLNVKDVKAHEIRLPPESEQAQIVQRVEQLFAFADQVEQRVADAQSRIESLTQSILAKAFRGELVPQDPNDEPASELLARIQKEREEAAAFLKETKKAAKKTAKKPAGKARAKKVASE